MQVHFLREESLELRKAKEAAVMEKEQSTIRLERRNHQLQVEWWGNRDHGLARGQRLSEYVLQELQGLVESHQVSTAQDQTCKQLVLVLKELVCSTKLLCHVTCLLQSELKELRSLAESLTRKNRHQADELKDSNRAQEAAHTQLMSLQVSELRLGGGSGGLSLFYRN